MNASTSTRILAIGEAMLEMAPVGSELHRLGYAGDTFNTVWHIAQLLGDRGTAGFVTRVGTDSLSDRFVAQMSADGLDIAGVSRDPYRQMGCYLIELEGAERSFHYWRRDSAARHLADSLSMLNEKLKGVRLIHVSGITLAILPPDTRENLFAALAIARDSGALVSFDPNIRPSLWSSMEELHKSIEFMLDLTDIALPSFEDEVANWQDASPEDTIARFCSKGVQEVIVKNGPNPIYFLAGGRSGTCNTPPVTEVRDTTGAGDAFNAGYLAARLLGASTRQAIAAGQDLSALVIGTFGARADRDKVQGLRKVAST